MINARPELLFWGGDTSDIVRHRKASLLQEITALADTEVLRGDVDELMADIVARHALNVLVLHEDEKHAERDEIQIDVLRDPTRVVFDRGRPVYLNAMRITIWVPFEGDPVLFQLRPSTLTSNPPCGEVSDKEVGCVIVDTDPTAEKVNAEFSRWLADVKQYLAWHRQDLSSFNASLVGIVREAITSRQQKLRTAEGLLAGLNIPLKQKSTNATSAPLPSRSLDKDSTTAASRAPMSDRKQYDCFVSYAGEDRSLVEQLVSALADMKVSVWWDKGQIRLGDKLSQKIDEGLRLSRYGLVVVSASFIAKRWTEAELRALAHRAISSGHRVILPVLIDMDHELFSATYPLLADIVSTTYRGNLKALAKEIVDAIG